MNTLYTASWLNARVKRVKTHLLSSSTEKSEKRIFFSVRHIGMHVLSIIYDEHINMIRLCALGHN
jgi:hypothetical protein